MQMICVLVGGPTYYMPGVQGRDWPFEMHPYMGPCPLTPKMHKPMEIKNEPPQFWKEWELYDLGGRKMDGDKCIVPQWCAACRGIGSVLEHLSGRQYLDKGPCPSCAGTRVVFSAAPQHSDSKE